MLTKIIKNQELLLVQVPNVESFEIRGMHPKRNYEILSFYGEDEAIELPTNKNYEILGLASELTEEEWKVVVESEFDTWLNYEEDEKLGSYYFNTATESGLSLLKSENLNPETNFILLKK